MKTTITKENLDQIERAVDGGCGAAGVYDQLTYDLWEKVRLFIEIPIIELVYEEPEESE